MIVGNDGKRKPTGVQPVGAWGENKRLATFVAPFNSSLCPISNLTPTYGPGRFSPDDPAVKRLARYFRIDVCVICHVKFAQRNRPGKKLFVTCGHECSEFNTWLMKKAAAKRTISSVPREDRTDTIQQFLVNMWAKYNTDGDSNERETRTANDAH
jgi:hypothetical protein